ncbi:MAG: hypothetical protein Q8K55_14675 [Gemmatimonadaceae bacterium]|nr:hypothetical protein [Gemmatimonadaceae bacterium]
MTPPRLIPPLSNDELRRRAEERLRAVEHPEDPERSAVDGARLLHELQVHQIELEMQNEALQQSRDDMEALLGGFIELYDDAPVGYLTLDQLGTIRQMNLTGARLLGVDRERMGQPRLGLFVANDDRTTLSNFIERVFTDGSSPASEITVIGEGRPPAKMRIEGSLSTDGERCRLVIVDLTARAASGPPAP